MLRLRATTLVLPIALAMLFSGTARADLQINLDTVINGVTPVGGTPWLSGLFHTNSPGDVTLTLTNLMSTSEFVSDWMFNVQVNGGFDATPLTATYISGPLYTLVQLASQSDNGGPNMKAGFFNLHFGWPTSNSDPNRFAGGESVVLQFTGGNITEDSFDFLSAPDPHGFGTFVSAAHVQGIPGTAGVTFSGSIVGDPVPSVPEPGSVFLLLGVVAGLAPAIRRRFVR